MNFRLERIILTLLIILAGWDVHTYAQESMLDDYISTALNQNLTFRQIELDEQIQSSKVDQAKKNWNPRVNLGTTYLLAEGGRKILFPIGDLFNPTYTTLNQLTNTEQFPTNLENVETQLTPNNFIDANLTVSKPLINSSIKHNIRIQEALLKLSGLDRDQQMSEIALQVKTTYYNLLKTYQAKKIISQNLNLLHEVRAFNQKLIKYDKATLDVLSDVDFQIAKLTKDSEVLNQQEAVSKILMNTLMNRKLSEEIVLDTTLLETIGVDQTPLHTLIAKAKSERSDLKKIDLLTEINTLDGRRIEDANLPTLGVQGGVGIQIEEFSLDGGGPLYTLAFNLGWDIWDGGLKKKRLEENRLKGVRQQNQKEIAEQQITLEVAQAYYELQSAQLMLQTEEEAIRSAKVSYDAIDKRYKNDRALLIELLTAQNQLLSSRLNKVLVSIDILIAEAKIKKAIHEW